eukprot:gb/GEZN01005450.1/.p1 GENE.gb/GEZN01005450.1/~~gb/GEZN01005450.1/.p1  ORF type:complete len:440 (+),score=42.42 gb/GEZN01005450.1/:457-1776(+)
MDHFLLLQHGQVSFTGNRTLVSSAGVPAQRMRQAVTGCNPAWLHCPACRNKIECADQPQRTERQYDCQSVFVLASRWGSTSIYHGVWDYYFSVWNTLRLAGYGYSDASVTVVDLADEDLTSRAAYDILDGVVWNGTTHKLGSMHGRFCYKVLLIGHTQAFKPHTERGAAAADNDTGVSDAMQAFSSHVRTRLGLDQRLNVTRLRMKPSVLIALRKGQRVFPGDPAVLQSWEAALQLEGIDVQIVSLAEVSAQQQLQYFRQATVLVAREGADLTNMLFFPPLSAFVEFNIRFQTHWYNKPGLLLDAVLGRGTQRNHSRHPGLLVHWHDQPARYLGHVMLRVQIPIVDPPAAFLVEVIRLARKLQRDAIKLQAGVVCSCNLLDFSPGSCAYGLHCESYRTLASGTSLDGPLVIKTSSPYSADGLPEQGPYTPLCSDPSMVR